MICNYIYLDLHSFVANGHRALTYFGSIINEIIMTILDVGVLIMNFGLNG